jgi:hypothetical protein
MGRVDGHSGAYRQSIGVVTGIRYLAGEFVTKNERLLHLKNPVPAVVVVVHVRAADAGSPQSYQHLICVDCGDRHLLGAQVSGSVEIECLHR